MGFTEFSLKIEIQTHESDWQNGFSKSNGCDHCIGRSALCRLWAISARVLEFKIRNFRKRISIEFSLWFEIQTHKSDRQMDVKAVLTTFLAISTCV